MRAIGRAIGDAFRFIGRTLKALFNLLWGFMVIFSFIVNLVLIVVVAVLGIYIFQIKNDIADPLLKGLHSSFVGLDEATIDWMIPVRDSVDAEFILPLEQNTVVVLTDDVPLTVSANISGPVSINNATVALTLPTGTRLPVSLDLDVPVNEEIPVNLDVRAVIPLAETQLNDPFDNLKLTFEPIILALDNLPNNFGEAFVFGNSVIVGQPPNLFDTSTSEYIRDPWPGFSFTAGLNYDLLAESRRLNSPGEVGAFGAQAAGGGSNVLRTGIVPVGGIPALDKQVRPDLYDTVESPQEAIEAAQANLEANGVPSESFAGDFDELEADALGESAATQNTDFATQAETDGEAVGGPSAAEGEAPLIVATPEPAFTAVPNN